MSRGASRPAAPSPGSTARRPRFAAREPRSSPTPTVGLAARHACRCPDPSRSAADSTRVARRTARCSGFRCRALDCRESCSDSRACHLARTAFRVQPLRQCLRRHACGVVTEDPTDHFGFGGTISRSPVVMLAMRAPRESPCSRSRGRLPTSRAPRVRAVRGVSCRRGPSGKARSSCP